MPFQSTYAELYFSKVFFPEFGARELRKAVREYSKRVRRFGGDDL
jgi:undecaprenyl diphosphate synthase